MRWEDFEAAEDGIIMIRNYNGIALWAENEDEAYVKAPADYGIVAELEKDDEDSWVSGNPYAVFKTTTDRDLFISTN